MMKKQFVLLSVISLLAFTTAVAQKSKSFYSSDYTTAIGVKLFPAPEGGAGAVTFKYFFKKDAAVEALGYFWQRGGRITGLYEFHWDINGAQGLKWFVGPGAHIAFYNDKYYNGNRYGGSYATVGVDGIIGLDYKFNKIPLNLSVDWQPFFDFGNGRYNGFGGEFAGVAARYTF
jgi:hypothetical protein